MQACARCVMLWHDRVGGSICDTMASASRNRVLTKEKKVVKTIAGRSYGNVATVSSQTRRWIIGAMMSNVIQSICLLFITLFIRGLQPFNKRPHLISDDITTRRAPLLQRHTSSKPSQNSFFTEHILDIQEINDFTKR